MDSLEKFKELFASECSLRSLRRNSNKYGWTDEMCMAEGQKRCVWKEIPVNDVEGHLIRFVNLWFSGEDNNVHEIPSILRNVLLLFPLGTSNELLLRNVFEAAVETVQSPPAIEIEKNVFKEPVVDHLKFQDKANVLEFYNWLKTNFHILKVGDEDDEKGKEAYNSASQRLRTVLGFCALILIRRRVRNDSYIKHYFPYNASKLFDLLFPEIGLTVSLVAPSPKCLELLSDTISSSSYTEKETADLIYLLVFQYLKSTIEGSEPSQFAKKVLEEGCLKYIEGNGLGLVQMFQDVKIMYKNIEERDLLSLVSEGNGSKCSRERLIVFLDTYTSEDNPQYSWKWARLLDHDYFVDLNIENNKCLCSKLAALCLEKNPNIFNHKTLKTGNIFAKGSIEWAENARKKLRELNESLGKVS